MPSKKDLTNQRFGRLTVLFEAEPHYTSGGNRKVMWFCKCDCGNEKKVSSGELLRGKTRSCGCYNYEQNCKSKFKQLCSYDLSNDDYCIGYTSKGDKFVFDKEDYEKVSQYNWFKHHNYFEAHIPMSSPRRTINLHRLVMGVSDKQYDYTEDVDHRNSKKWDNRKCNLRIVSKRQNNFNHKLQKNNSSGFAGVQCQKEKNGRVRWRVSFNFESNIVKTIDCHSKEEAIALRRKLEEIYYGEYSYNNSQKKAKEYEIKEE